MAKEWERAAIVYAFTYEGVNRHDLDGENSSPRKSIKGFAELGIKSLSTRDPRQTAQVAPYRAFSRSWPSSTSHRAEKSLDQYVDALAEIPRRERRRLSRPFSKGRKNPTLQGKLAT